MKVRFGGPVPVRFEMNGLMVAGVLLGAAGVVVWALLHFEVLPREGRWDDVALGVTLLGIALYFLGRIVDLIGHLRRRR